MTTVNETINLITYDFGRYSQSCAAEFPSDNCTDPGIEVLITYQLLQSLGFSVKLIRVESMDDIAAAFENGTADFAALSEFLPDLIEMSEGIHISPVPISSDRYCFAYRPTDSAVLGLHHASPTMVQPNLPITSLMIFVYVSIKLFHAGYSTVLGETFFRIVTCAWFLTLTILLVLSTHFITINLTFPAVHRPIVTSPLQLAERLEGKMSTLLVLFPNQTVRDSKETFSERETDKVIDQVIYPQDSSYIGHPTVARKFRNAYNRGNVPMATTQRTEFLEILLQNPEKVIGFDIEDDLRDMTRATGCPIHVFCLPNTPRNYYHWYWRKSYHLSEYLQDSMGAIGREVEGMLHRMGKDFFNRGDLTSCDSQSYYETTSQLKFAHFASMVYTFLTILAFGIILFVGERTVSLWLTPSCWVLRLGLLQFRKF